MAFKEGSCGPVKYGMGLNPVCINSLFQRDCAPFPCTNTSERKLMDKHNDTDKKNRPKCTRRWRWCFIQFNYRNSTLMMQFGFRLPSILHWLGWKRNNCFRKFQSRFLFDCDATPWSRFKYLFFSILQTQIQFPKRSWSSEKVNANNIKSLYPLTVSRLREHMFAK